MMFLAGHPLGDFFQTFVVYGFTGPSLLPLLQNLLSVLTGLASMWELIVFHAYQAVPPVNSVLTRVVAQPSVPHGGWPVAKIGPVHADPKFDIALLAIDRYARE